jgi:ribosome-binding ATPase YchF (GTP1/OBG family)
MLTIGEYRFTEALYHYMRTVTFTDFEPVKEDDNEREILTKQLQQIEKKREKYQRAWASDLISDKEFEKRMEETRETYEELKEKMSKIKTPVPIDTEVIKDIVFTFNENFQFLTDEEKKMFISQFIRRIEFDLIPQPPLHKKNKKGKEKVVITKVDFY